MQKPETATLANGCFWCADAVYRQMRGIVQIKSGYTGGKEAHPTYGEVVHGRTQHAEAVQLEFDTKVISFREILLVFFATHDPTSLNRQGYDTGAHYRSVIFFHSSKQREIAQALIDELNRSTFEGKIVTTLEAAGPFYEAENMHQDFYHQHREVPYCQIIIDPKIAKLRQLFADKLKPKPLS